MTCNFNQIASASKDARLSFLLLATFALLLLTGCGASTRNSGAQVDSTTAITTTPTAPTTAAPTTAAPATVAPTTVAPTMTAIATITEDTTRTPSAGWDFASLTTPTPTFVATRIRIVSDQAGTGGGLAAAADPEMTAAARIPFTPTPERNQDTDGPVPPFAPSKFGAHPTPAPAQLSLLAATASLPRVSHLYKGEGNFNGSDAPPLPDIEMPQTLADGWDRTENFLVMGTDRQRGATDWRTDSLMVVGLDRAAGTAAILSIPRDLYVDIPGYGWGRINQADFLGEMREENGGPELLGGIIESNLGIPTQHWVRFHMDGFIPLIDALGGITITLDTPFYDMWESATTDRRLELYLPAGENHLDGYQAYLFSRLRYVGSDVGRASRQRAVLWALREKLTQGEALMRLPELFAAYQDSVSTDLSIVDIAFLANEVLGLDQADIHASGIGLADLQDFVTSGGAQVLLMNDPLHVRKLVESIWDDDAATMADSFRGNAPGTEPAPPATPIAPTNTISDTNTFPASDTNSNDPPALPDAPDTGVTETPASETTVAPISVPIEEPAATVTETQTSDPPSTATPAPEEEMGGEENATVPTPAPAFPNPEIPEAP